MHWRRKWQPTPAFLPGESQGRRSLVGAIYGVAQSWTRLKRLSSSRSSTLQALSSLTKDQTHAIAAIGSTESQPLDHQGNPTIAVLSY